MTISSLIIWIENHPATTEIIKGVILLLIAWGAGVFRLLGKFTKRGQLEIIDTASICFIEEKDEFEGHKNLVRVAYLINITMRNPSNEKVVVESFALSHLSTNKFKPYPKGIHSSTLPNRPRLEMGSGIKLCKVFFTNFSDDQSSNLTMNGVLAPKNFQSGYIYFVSFTWGTWNPKVLNKKIKIKIRAKLTTGEICKNSAWIRTTKDKGDLEKIVPGIMDQTEHPGSWNIPID